MDYKTTQKKNKSRVLSNEQFSVYVPTSWCPDSFPTEFSNSNNIRLTGRRPFPYPFQQHSGCLLSLCHDFHSIISTFLLFRETCNKRKARSAWTVISLSELTTVNLRESTRSEDLHSFKENIWPPQSPAARFRQRLRYKRALDSRCHLRSVLQRGNILPLAHVGSGGAQLLQPLPPLRSRGRRDKSISPGPAFKVAIAPGSQEDCTRSGKAPYTSLATAHPCKARWRPALRWGLAVLKNRSSDVQTDWIITTKFQCEKKVSAGNAGASLYGQERCWNVNPSTISHHGMWTNRPGSLGCTTVNGTRDCHV